MAYQASADIARKSGAKVGTDYGAVGDSIAGWSTECPTAALARTPSSGSAFNILTGNYSGERLRALAV